MYSRRADAESELNVKFTRAAAAVAEIREASS